MITSAYLSTTLMVFFVSSVALRHCSILKPLDLAIISPSRYGGLESDPTNIKTTFLFKSLRTGRSKRFKKVPWVKNIKTSYLSRAHNNKSSIVNPYKLYHKVLLKLCDRGVPANLALS